jgi:hypothetical protein
MTESGDNVDAATRDLTFTSSFLYRHDLWTSLNALIRFIVNSVTMINYCGTLAMSIDEVSVEPLSLRLVSSWSLMIALGELGLSVS